MGDTNKITVLGLSTFLLAVAAFVTPAGYCSQFLTVEEEDVSEVVMTVGESITIEINSTDYWNYWAYIGFYEMAVPASFVLLEIRPEAGDEAYAEVYEYGGFSGYFVATTGFAAAVSDDPYVVSPGIHFVLEYTPLEAGEETLVLMDLEYYFIDELDIIVEDVPSGDTEPPVPDPMTWASPPRAISGTEITMTATTASDPSGVQYYFETVAGHGHSSGWQSSPIYTDTGLVPNSEYWYRVQARDMSENHNETGWSWTLSATTTSDEQLAAGLVGYWAMDDGYGLTAADGSGNDNHGSLRPGVIPLWTPAEGRLGGAIRFDGDGGYIDCGSHPDFDITDEITIAAWVNINEVSADYMTIIAKGDSAWRLSTAGLEARFHFGITGGPPWHTVDGYTEIPLGEWHHVCGTYDGTYIRLYVDGMEDGMTFYGGEIATNTYNVWIGENPEARGRYFDGLIDDVRIYDRALDSSQVLVLGKHGIAPRIRPVALWTLDEETGLIAGDSAPGGLHQGSLSAGKHPSWDVGKIGGALLFHGDGEYVNCGRSPVFDFTDEITLAAWVNIDPVSSAWAGIVAKGVAWGISTVGTTRRFRFTVPSLRTSMKWIDGDGEVPADEWHHVCGVYDGAQLRLYIDGAEDPASPVAHTGPISGRATEVWIGGNPVGLGAEFHGLIDDVAIWSRALDPEEIDWLGGDGRAHPVRPVKQNYVVDDDAKQDPGPGNPDIGDPLEDGSPAHPFDSIQEAIDAAADGDRILVLDGTYGGNGNRDIDFGGKAITVRSENGPGYCVIDCQGSPAENHRGFYFHSGEAADSVLEGFTITGGFWDDEGEGGAGICCVGCSPVIRGCIVADNKAYRGGGLYCSDSSATLVDCTIAENEATSRWPGGGMHCDSSALTLSSCSVAKNRPYGIWLYESDLGVFGTIKVTSNNLAGNGTVRLDQAATLEIIGSQVNCEIAGGGTIHVPVGSELTIGSNGTVDLDGPDARGTIRCDGFLKAVDNGAIYNATVEVYRASFEDDSVIVNNVISTQGTGPLAQVVVKGAATIMGNDIHASGDNYIYLDAQLFTGVIEENRIYVTFGEDQSSQDSRLFELRGLDLFCTKRPCEPGMFPLWAVPEFSLDTWTIDRLELGRGVEVTLANRFNFQPPYHSRRDDEVLYVRELVLGPDSVLDMAFNRLYYETLTQDPAAKIVNVPLLGFALDKMDFGDADEFFRRVTDNNFEHPLYGRVHVERIEGAAPDPTGLMRMRNLRDNDPASPTWGRMVQSWTKCSFPQLSESRVLIRFEYLFEVEVPGLELLVFLSDVPYLPGPDDLEHRIEVGSVRATLAGRPGSVGSGRFGVFEKWASTESLDLSQGAWITLELQQSEGLESYAASGGAKTELASADSGGGAVLVDGLGPEVHCDGICMDLNWSDAADEEDFLLVIGSCGESSGLLESGTGSRYCLEGAFSSDGFVDAFDIGSWDWTLGDLSRVQGGNFCRVPIPLVDEGVSAMNGAIVKSAAYADRPQLLASGDSTEELLILGKRRTTQYASELLKDRFCAFDASGTYVTDYSKPGLSDRGNIRVVPGNGDDLYLVNSEDGVLQIDGAVEEVIPSGTTSYAGDPRYGRSATVCIGIQGDGSESAGRPILDVAFGADGYAYVVPVVVKPDGKDAYVAAAKLRLLSSAEPPYQVVRLYDDPPLETDNQYRDNLREIEVDSSGNVYVANVHRLNESDKLWQYGPDGTVLRRVELGNPTGDNYIPDPIAMHASDNTGRLYLASALYNSADADSTIIHSFSLDNLAREGSITIRGIQHVTGITEEPGTGDLWVVGFTMAEIPAWPDPTKPPFYEPYLAKVPRDVDTVQASSIVDSGSHDLALPMSIVWTGASDCLPSCHEDHAEWVAVGRPDCWCYPRQCHGDADGQKAGSSKTGYYHVGPTDLNVLLSAWLVKEPPYGLGIASVPDGICADFAHDEGGSTKTGRYRVGPSDLNIMIANWLIKEPPHGPDVPADCSDCP